MARLGLKFQGDEMRKLVFLIGLLTTATAMGSASRYLDGQYITNGSATLTLPLTTGSLLLTTGDGSNLTGITASQAGAVPTTRTVNGYSLSSDVTLTKSDIGLGNVTNDAQVKASDFTAKGILLGGTGSGTYTGLTVGTNGQILSADSGEATGLKWIAVPSVSPTVSGSTGSPISITAVGGISFSGTNYNNITFIVGSGGAVDISASPQIAGATNVGQRLVLIGTSDTNTVKLEDGTGLSLNGVFIAANNSVIGLVWNGAVWVEEFRR